MSHWKYNYLLICPNLIYWKCATEEKMLIDHFWVSILSKNVYGIGRVTCQYTSTKITFQDLFMSYIFWYKAPWGSRGKYFQCNHFSLRKLLLWMYYDIGLCFSIFQSNGGPMCNAQTLVHMYHRDRSYDLYDMYIQSFSIDKLLCTSRNVDFYVPWCT